MKETLKRKRQEAMERRQRLKENRCPLCGRHLAAKERQDKIKKLWTQWQSNRIIYSHNIDKLDELIREAP